MTQAVDRKTISDKNQINLQHLLRAIRKEAGLSQLELAIRLGKPQSFVSKYEIGERRLDILELRQICGAVNISLSAFIHRLEKSLSEGNL